MESSVQEVPARGCSSDAQASASSATLATMVGSNNPLASTIGIIVAQPKRAFLVFLHFSKITNLPAVEETCEKGTHERRKHRRIQAE